MLFDPMTMLYLAAAALLTATLHSVGGFAGGLMLAIIIAPVVGIKATVPVASVAMIVSHASRAWLFRKTVDWSAFRIIFATALPCIFLGILFYIDLPEKGVAMFLACFLVVTLILRRVLAKRKIVIPRIALAGVAVPYGFLAGASFGAGMILGPFMLGAGISGEALLATIAVMGFLLNVIKTVAFGFSPFLTLELALVGLMLGACTIPGHSVGRWIVRRTPIRIHTLFLEAVILAGALYFFPACLLPRRSRISTDVVMKNKQTMSSKLESIATDLKRLDFSDYEARIYLQTLQQSSSTAYELSMSSGVPRPNTYAALKNLSKRGAVLLVSTSPAKYVASQPRELLDRLSRQTNELCESLTTRLENLAPASDDPHVWTIRGESDVHDRIEKMIVSSSQSIWIKASDEILRQHLVALQKAAARGVSLLVILFGDDPDEFRFNDNCKVYSHEGDGIRIGVADNLFTLAIDSEEMLTASMLDDVVAAHTRNQAMVTMALSLIRHDYYMAEICQRFSDQIHEAYGPFLRDLRFPGYTDEQKSAFLRKTANNQD